MQHGRCPAYDIVKTTYQLFQIVSTVDMVGKICNVSPLMFLSDSMEGIMEYVLD